MLAFGWIHPLTLGWLAAAAAPIVIHLWSRRQYREAPFAAIEFLLAAARRQSRRLRFEQWLLLAIRTLLIILVVLAAAEPFTELAGFAFSPGGRVHRVLVFDGSYSMAYRSVDKTRFERAKEMARRIVAQSAQGDAFTLVLMASSPRVVVSTPAIEPSALLEEIENLRLPQTTADLPAALPAIQKLIEGVGRDNPRLDRHEVYFFTDVQRLTWAPRQSEAEATESRRRMDDLAGRAALFLMDVGDPSAENLAIESLRTPDAPAIVGRDVSLEVRLRNFGGQAMARQPVELWIDGGRVARKFVDLAPLGTAAVTFSQRFDAPGERAIEVRATGDALDVDNHRYLALLVRRTIRALCIEGKPASEAFKGAADYLLLALGPQGQANDGAIRAEKAGENALSERNLGRYDCLFLCNVAQFMANEVHALDAYLQGGGSVVVFLGDQVAADRYNRGLGVVGEKSREPNRAGEGWGGQGRADETRLLPARLGTVVEKPQYRLDPRDYRHPILKAFRGQGQASLLTTPVFKHFKLLVPEGSPARTALATADGDPLMVDCPVRRGRVLLVATSADPTWTALPLWPSFVPLAREIVAWTAAGQLEGRNLTVGEPIEAAYPAPGGETPVEIESPDGRRRAVKPRAAGDFAAINDPETWQSGFYVVRFGPPVNREPRFAVNVDTAEGDLTPVDLEGLALTWPGVPLVHQTSWHESAAVSPNIAAAASGGCRLHVRLLYLALALTLFETFWAWHASHRSTPTERFLTPDP